MNITFLITVLFILSTASFLYALYVIVSLFYQKKKVVPINKKKSKHKK